MPIQNWPRRSDQIYHDTGNPVWLSPRGIPISHTLCLLLSGFWQNPLHFSFPPEIDADALMSGAEQLSQAVLESGMVLFFRRALGILNGAYAVQTLRLCGHTMTCKRR